MGLAKRMMARPARAGMPMRWPARMLAAGALLGALGGCAQALLPPELQADMAPPRPGEPNRYARRDPAPAPPASAPAAADPR
jgi:hypothetical protein